MLLDNKCVQLSWSLNNIYTISQIKSSKCYIVNTKEKSNIFSLFVLCINSDRKFSLYWRMNVFKLQTFGINKGCA